MKLSPGTKLGPYEIVSPLGAGGMGEVYRARDTRLDRDVAIKVLAGHLTVSDEVRQRFEREARAVSSLNHPNICTLHDIGHEDGVDFLVLEYMEGETLQDRIARGPLPLKEVLGIGVQIADALDRAHRQNLIHRDLKPGNIMLTRSGAKLLDFGLARSMELADKGDLTQSPTMARSLTAEGAIIGTFQYMAPEQLEGRPADARTDIFALGAVLYEMATGKHAFQGDSQASLIASILKDEPRAITTLLPVTPPAFERVVHRCLEKKPDDRWQTARDLMLELTWIRDAGSQAGVAAPVREQRRNRQRFAWAAAAVFAVATAALGAALVLQPKPQEPLTRFVVQPLDRGSAIMVSQAHMKASPDGRSIVFVASDTLGVYRLWVNHMESRRAMPLNGTEGGGLPFWSPDSRHIGFFVPGRLMRVPASGGAPQMVCAAPDGRGGAWNRDDVIVFAPSSDGPLFQVPAGGGQPVQVTQVDSASGEQGHRFPCFLPDRKHFLYVSLPAKEGVFSTYVGSLDSRERSLAVRAGGAAVFAEPGLIIYDRDQSLVAQRFDTGRLEATGPVHPLGEPAGVSGGWSGSPSVSASDNGVLIRTASSAQFSVVVEMDARGNHVRQLALDAGLYFDVALSPDGHRLVASRLSTDVNAANMDIFVIDLDRYTATRITFDPSTNAAPIWSPDSRRIAFHSDRGGNESIYVKSASGAGEEIRVLENQDQLFVRPNTWTPDGRTIVYHTLSGETGYDIWTADADGKQPAKPLIVTRFNEKGGVLSPDGRYFAYHSDESGTFELYVVPFPDLTEKYRVSLNGAGAYGDLLAVLWTSGGDLLYEDPTGLTLMRVPVSDDGGFRVGKPVSMMRLPRNRLASLTGDGRRFFAAVSADDSANSLLYVVSNFTSLLRDR